VFLDALKDFGFRYSTQAGVSVGIEDMEIPAEKDADPPEADEDVARFTRAYNNGVISNGERYNKVIDTWTHANNDVADAMVNRLALAGAGSTPST
jgi:DNA-directed RNA polymerase subunit beta'